VLGISGCVSEKLYLMMPLIIFLEGNFEGILLTCACYIMTLIVSQIENVFLLTGNMVSVKFSSICFLNVCFLSVL